MGVFLGGGRQESISVAVRIWEQLKPFGVYLDANIKSDRLCVANAVSEVCTGWTRVVKIRARAEIFPFTVECRNDPGARSVLNPMLTPLLTPWSRVFWEANRLSASQEISRILCNPKIHHRIHKCPPPVPDLSQLDPAHIPTSHFVKIHLNIIVPSNARVSQVVSFPWVSPPKAVYASLRPHTRYLPRPSHSFRFYDPNSIRWIVQMDLNPMGNLLLHFQGRCELYIIIIIIIIIMFLKG